MIFDYSGRRLLPFCCLVPSPTERENTSLPSFCGNCKCTVSFTISVYRQYFRRLSLDATIAYKFAQTVYR